MKVHLGPVPHNPAFRPEKGDWRVIKEPAPWVAQLCAAPIALAIVAGLVVGWSAVARLPGSAGQFRISVWTVLFACLVTVPLHELVHAACHPDGGRSAETLVGLWPQKIAFYTHYQGEMSRNRFLLVLIAPFLLLTLGPLAISAASSMISPFLVLVSVVNGVGASVDLFGVALVGLQLPPSAELRHQGHRTWWRDGDQRRDMV